MLNIPQRKGVGQGAKPSAKLSVNKTRKAVEAESRQVISHSLKQDR
jgi:hypothetical protein